MVSYQNRFRFATETEIVQKKCAFSTRFPVRSAKEETGFVGSENAANDAYTVRLAYKTGRCKSTVPLLYKMGLALPPPERGVLCGVS